MEKGPSIFWACAAFPFIIPAVRSLLLMQHPCLSGEIRSLYLAGTSCLGIWLPSLMIFNTLGNATEDSRCIFFRLHLSIRCSILSEDLPVCALKTVLQSHAVMVLCGVLTRGGGERPAGLRCDQKGRGGVEDGSLCTRLL